jgi:regulator of RNase E activity RraA
MALDGDPAFAVFGATFAAVAKSRRLGGFVVDAAIRSVSDFRRLGVAMFARGTVAGSAGGHYRLDAIHVPIRCGGIEIVPGDFVVGDADGIAIAPKERYQEILSKAAELRDERQALLPLIAKHRSFTAAFERRRAALIDDTSRHAAGR